MPVLPCRGDGGKADDERRALPRLAAYGDVAAVRPDNVPADRQAQAAATEARAGPGAFGLLEAMEQARQLRGIHAGPGVLHHECQRARVAGGTQPDAS